MKSVANRNVSIIAWYALMLAPIQFSACNLGPKFAVVGSREFALMDKSGNVRGGLYAYENGSLLALSDGSGQTRVVLFARDDSAGIFLLDESGKHRVLIATVDALGVTYVALLDDKGDIASTLGLVRDKGFETASQEEIERDAKRLLEKLKLGWLEGLREIDKQVH